MIRLIPFLLVLALLWGLLPRLVRHLRAQAPSERRRFLNTSFLWLPALLLVGLAGLGRISLWTAGLAVLVPLTRTLAAKRRSAERFSQQDPQRSSASPAAPKDRQRALAILGLESGATDEQILAAHRNLARKMHPDQGGSNYLAAEINWARDTLLSARR